MNSVGNGRTRRRLAGVVVVAAALLGPLAWSSVAVAGPGLSGAGSSFAFPEVEQWITDTAASPYNLAINYSSSSSGDGRLEFADQTIDFGVSDIQYQPQPYDTKSPNFPFIYVPVTAGGLAFMYHLDGLAQPLQLSSYSACAIFTGGVTNWNDPVIQADNPGVSLPNVPIHPVTRSDPAGTNYVLEEWCIDEQPQLWAAFANSPATLQYPGQVQDLSATQPHSHWPFFQNAVPTDAGSAAAADTVADPTKNGYITAVETEYAVSREHSGNGVGVASVKNASGVYTQPTPVNVASGLAYATQLQNGTHQLNFNGPGVHVYNPSTYSYVIVRTSGWDPAKGKVFSEFVDYALTLGQQRAPEIQYASLGLSLEQFGINEVKNQVPGAVDPTAAEQRAYACGDLTPAEVQAGQTTPTCGVINPQSSNAGGTIQPAGAAATAATTRTSASGSRGSGGLAGADPSVSLGGTSPLAFTGVNPSPIVFAGAALVMAGYLGRRRLLGRRVTGSER